MYVANSFSVGVAPVEPNVVTAWIVAACAVVATRRKYADFVQVRTVRFCSEWQIREGRNTALTCCSPVAAATEVKLHSAVYAVNAADIDCLLRRRGLRRMNVSRSVVVEGELGEVYSIRIISRRAAQRRRAKRDVSTDSGAGRWIVGDFLSTLEHERTLKTASGPGDRRVKRHLLYVLYVSWVASIESGECAQSQIDLDRGVTSISDGQSRLSHPLRFCRDIARVPECTQCRDENA